MDDPNAPIPYPNNRIGDPTTAATAATDARLAAIKPGQGGWVPPGWVPYAGAVLAGILAAVGTVVTAGTLAPAAIIGAALLGAGAGIGTLFGIKSAGPRKLD